jgi:hypothetical protein
MAKEQGADSVENTANNISRHYKNIVVLNGVRQQQI